jgi:hypothetical protein
MTTAGTIELSGHCGVEDAELLQRFLLATKDSTVEWHGCEHLHSAVIQVLAVARPRLEGSPLDSFLTTHIAPLLQRAFGAGVDAWQPHSEGQA